MVSLVHVLGFAHVHCLEPYGKISRNIEEIGSLELENDLKLRLLINNAIFWMINVSQLLAAQKMCFEVEVDVAHFVKLLELTAVHWEVCQWQEILV